MWGGRGGGEGGRGCKGVRVCVCVCVCVCDHIIQFCAHELYLVRLLLKMNWTWYARY